MVDKWSLETISTDGQESFEAFSQTESPDNGNGVCTSDAKFLAWEEVWLRNVPLWSLASLLTSKMVVRKGRVEETDCTGLHLSTSTSLQKSWLLSGLICGCKMGVTVVPVSYSFCEKCLAHNDRFVMTHALGRSYSSPPPASMALVLQPGIKPMSPALEG